MSNIFERAETQKATSSRKVPKGLTRNYIQELIALGKGTGTNRQNGIKIKVSEELYQTLDIPTADEAEKTGVYTGYYKSNFIGDDGDIVYMVYLMFSAGPDVAIQAGEDLGLPDPITAHNTLLGVVDKFPEY